MPKVAAVLSSQDCKVIGCHNQKDLQSSIYDLMTSKPYVNNAAHRLSEVAWLT